MRTSTLRFTKRSTLRAADKKLQHHPHNPGNPLEYRVGKGMKKVGKIEKKVGRRAFTHGHPVLGAAAYAEGVGHRGAGKILKHDGKHGK